MLGGDGEEGRNPRTANFCFRLGCRSTHLWENKPVPRHLGRQLGPSAHPHPNFFSTIYTSQNLLADSEIAKIKFTPVGETHSWCGDPLAVWWPEPGPPHIWHALGTEWTQRNKLFPALPEVATLQDAVYSCHFPADLWVRVHPQFKVPRLIATWIT